MYQICILASGNGTNAQQMAEYFEKSEQIRIHSIIYNKKKAYVAERAKKLGIATKYFCREDFTAAKPVLDYLKESRIDYLVLAGFLLPVPQQVLDAYPDRIVNIHPSLLPKYGGKGMYGKHVHEAVIAAGERETGITIHTIDNEYDKGTILFQARCTIEPGENAEQIAEKVHLLEKQYYPCVVEQWIMGNENRD